MQFIKYLIIFFSYLLSFSVVATDGVFNCDNHHTLQRNYKDLHQLKIKKADTVLWYNLAHTSLCLGKITEGMIYLRKASDAGHIMATYLLSIYYEKNHTLNPSEKTKNLTNLNQAIFYATKAAELIKSTPHYPEGTTNDMPHIEYQMHTSFYVFTYLPIFYFSKYILTLKQIIRNKKTIAYNDTLDILNKISETALACINRPVLAIWSENSESIYKIQQTTCDALLTFVETAYLLEEQRIQIHQNCIDSIIKCTEQHYEVTKKIIQLTDIMTIQIQLVPNSKFLI